jgi:hypothetical protein
MKAHLSPRFSDSSLELPVFDGLYKSQLDALLQDLLNLPFLLLNIHYHLLAICTHSIHKPEDYDIGVVTSKGICSSSSSSSAFAITRLSFGSSETHYHTSPLFSVHSCMLKKFIT